MSLSGTRINTLTHLKVTNMYITDTECTFVFDVVLKHSKPKYCQKPLILRAYPECPELCPVRNLSNHLNIRLARSSDPALFFPPQNHLSQCQGIQLPDGLRIQ